MSLARLAKLLRAVTDVGETMPLAPPAELLAGVVLENERPEWEYLKGQRLCVGYASEAASAGVRSIVALVNPLGSNVLAIVERIQAQMGGPVLLAAAFHTSFAAFDPDGTEWVRDFRAGVSGLGLTQQTSCKIHTDQRGLLGAAVVRLFPTSNDGTYYITQCDIPFILPGGVGIATQPLADNEANQTSFFWRELALTPEMMRDANPRLG